MAKYGNPLAIEKRNKEIKERNKHQQQNRMACSASFNYVGRS